MLVVSGSALAQTTAPTTLNDFFINGTQPGDLTDGIAPVGACTGCHAGYDDAVEPGRNWAAGPMGQAMRDPLFVACMAIANQDAAFAGDLCLRCHTPKGWLEGRSTPTDGSALITSDYEGINCHFCHRMIDPVYTPGVSPVEDQAILAGMAFPPVGAHSGNFAMDPLDVRRGPFDLDSFNSHDWLEAAFYSDSDQCGTCHDVSNPVFERQPDGTYAIGALDTPHPTQNKHDMFPIERTYSEWLMSDFALGPIEMGGRFGGNITAVSTCQDCHMPDATGRGCNRASRPIRDNLPTHEFNGGNNWLLYAVRNLYPDNQTLLTDSSVADWAARTLAMLEAASDMELTQIDDTLNVRVINQTGHKLPSGYPEGRRMWINVRFLDSGGGLVAEHGAYDSGTATLTTGDTTVYETKLGLDAAVAAVTGLPEGEGFHFAVNNLRLKDNRIPPRGFTNANFEAIGSEPIGHPYPDGQYWDDALFAIPQGAEDAEVRLYYQSASREYVEFLRDANEDSVGDPMNPSEGEIMYDQWLATGMSPPVEMDFATIELTTAPCAADFNGDGAANGIDVGLFLQAYGTQNPSADMNGDGQINGIDVGLFLQAYAAGC